MNKPESLVRVPVRIGQQPLVGNFYPAECTLCGWVGSSEALTDECQCTQEAGNHFCLGDTEEIGADRLLEIIQAMDRRHAESQQAYFRLNEHSNETEKQLDSAAELLGAIVKGGEPYAECTDKSSATGLQVTAVMEYVAQFQPEPHQPNAAEKDPDDDWHMNPCKEGHRDVGAAGGVAQCNQCGEAITAASTHEAYERWNAAHPAVGVS